jgi:hypothetical protein
MKDGEITRREKNLLPLARSDQNDPSMAYLGQFIADCVSLSLFLKDRIVAMSERDDDDKQKSETQTTNHAKENHPLDSIMGSASSKFMNNCSCRLSNGYGPDSGMSFMRM